jgi:ubiquinone/menaquinone biosynthesis C-methylase UbiE
VKREKLSLSERVRQEYEALAPVYDRRWRHYINTSLDATLARLPLSGGETILDIGCGSGELLRRLQVQFPALRLVGADASMSMLAVARHKLSASAALCNATAEALPFATASFDVIFSTSVLHYWPEPARALAELRRVLRPGGRLTMTDWCGDYVSCRATAAGLRLMQRPVAQVYRAAECRRLLERTGLKIERLERYKISRWWGLMTAVAAA